MSFFTIGNLLTLGIVILTLVLYRQLDRNNRSVDKARRYGDRLKEDLAVFVAEKESAVRDYAVELDVQQKAAKELMKRLNSADDELAGRTEAVARIDERLNAYDASLEDLMRMTGRVEENLARIRDESAFVESAGKRMTEVKTKLEALEKELESALPRFERENAASLEQASEAVIAAVRSAVSDLQAAAETAERQVDDHREAIAKAEKNREMNIARDTELIDKTLKSALEQAAARANKMEDAAVVKLREEALERVRRFQEAVEEKLRLYQDSAKNRVAEVQGLVKSYKEEWRGEHAEMEAKQKAYRDEWKQDVQELNVLARALREEWKRAAAEGDAQTKEQLAALEAASAESVQRLSAETGAMEQRIRQIEARANESLSGIERRLSDGAEEAERKLAAQDAGIEQRLGNLRAHLEEEVSSLEERFVKYAEAAEQRVLEAADLKLEEYRTAQTLQYRQLDTLADDVKKLDAELRFSMQETENRVRQDFALFEREAAAGRERSAAGYAASVEALKADLAGVERELAALKERAYENVSEKLKLFEDDFGADLTRRSAEIDTRLGEWREALDEQLAAMGAETAAERRNLELSFSETLKSRLSLLDDQQISELEHLKAETGAFEEGIRDQMAQADQSLRAFKEQLDQDLEETRGAAEVSAKAEIGRYALAMAETLKQNQREVETALREIADQAEARIGEMTGVMDNSRRDLEEWQSRFTAQLRETETAAEDIRRRFRESAAENDERLAALRSAVEEVGEEAAAHRNEIFSRTDEHARALESAIKDADRHIKEFINQTKLFDRADELKLHLERRIEDLRSDLNGLDQRRAEAAELETQFVKIKRLEDEVNAKMTRFLSEQRRIELMEADFNRLIETSQSVEERLVQVSSSDDTLQAIQVQIRRLNDAMADTEERYQRIEKKNSILEETNSGIDRNFKSLQEAEHAVKRFNEELLRLSGEQEAIGDSLEDLAAKNTKARETAEKLSTLDATLADIEERIGEMNKAREWLARTETRLEEVYKQTQTQIQVMGTLYKDEAGKGSKDRGAPPIGTRETVVKLAHAGWKIDEIARAAKLSKGEVELILEIGPRD
jgi:chromosome segregation ATPase